MALSGKRLRKIRLERNWSQTTMAQSFGVTMNTQARWERGEQPIPHWVTVVLTFEVRLANQLADHKAHVDELGVELERLRALVGEYYSRPEGRSSAGSPLAVDAIYKKLVWKYHPDRNPHGAEVMTDINEAPQGDEVKISTGVLARNCDNPRNPPAKRVLKKAESSVEPRSPLFESVLTDSITRNERPSHELIGGTRLGCSHLGKGVTATTIPGVERPEVVLDDFVKE